MYPRYVVAHRDYNGDVAVGGTGGRPRMRNGRVEERTRHLCTQRVVHLEPAAVEHGLRGGRQPQQARGGTAEQRRALPEHLDSAIDLNGEPVGQPRLAHVSIPSRSGFQRAIRRTHLSTISANNRSPSAAVAVVGSPRTPSSLTAAT